MKKITAFLGLVGVVCLTSGCSDTDTLSAPEELTVAISSDTGSMPKSSSSSKKSSSSSKRSSSSTTHSGGEVVHDTVHTQVIITSSGSYETPNYSNGVFCWNEPCQEVKPIASSSSAASIEVNMSSEPPVLPEINGNNMVDKRDNKSYALQNVAGRLWMAQNLNYETSSGSFCSAPGGSDMCAKYGRYYSSAASKKACPTGWRLPTSEEIAAADREVPEEWWTLGGRIKFSGESATDYGLDEQQGYWWIDSGASWRVQPDSKEHVEQSAGGGDGRAYSVRCVQGE